MGSIWRKTHVDALPRHTASSEHTIGALEEISGKVQAHPRSGVVMDIAAFKVSHSVNKDATALRAKESDIKLHRGDGTLRMGSIPCVAAALL